MLTAIVRWSLRHRYAVIGAACAFLAYGAYLLTQVKYDVFPEFAPPQVSVQTEAPGLSPEQVELLVTQPLEQAINGIEGVTSLRSQSIQGLSVVTVTFDAHANAYRDRQLITERLVTVAGRLPREAQTPVMTPLTSSTGDLMTFGLTSDARSLMELRTTADWLLKPRLLAVPGVAQVSVFGGEVQQLQIQVQPDRLAQYNVSLSDVISAAGRASGVRGGGFLDTPNQRVIVQTEGQALTPDQFRRAVLALPGADGGSLNVTLGDLATVVNAPEPPISAAAVMGRPGVVINVWAQYGSNTIQVTEQLERALNELRPALDAQQVTLHPNLFRAATFIHTAVHNIVGSLALGAILVIVVLYLFLRDVRTAAISCAAIPLSLIAAIAVLHRAGLTLNTMTLGGLAIALGVVVDDAVIDVENAIRRIRQNRRLSRPHPLGRVILDASIEVRSAIVHATFAIALVCLPILTLSGLAGRLFAPLGWAYLSAILASLVVALTITPALCLLLLREQTIETKPPRLVRWLRIRHRRALTAVEANPRPLLVFVVACAVLGAAAMPFFDREFLPELREGHFLLHMTAVPGTSLQESMRLGNQVTHALLQLPIVRTVAQRAGRAAADDTFGPHSSEFEIDLKPLSRHQTSTAQQAIREVLDRFPPGIGFALNTFMTERIEETLSGYTAPVIVRVVGRDLDALDATAQEVANALRRVPGAADVQVESPPGTPQLGISLKADALARWGFDAVDVLETIRAAYQGEVVGQLYAGDRVVTALVILSPEVRTLTNVGSLPLRSPTGLYVRLRELADLREASGRYVILHDGARRIQTITCGVSGRSVGDFVREAKQRVHSSVTLPEGFYTEFSGTVEEQSRSTAQLLVHVGLAIFCIVLLLSTIVGSRNNLLLVLASLPFALVGGVFAVFASGGRLSLGSLVGFVTLFGLTLRNSIMLVSHYEHLVHTEGLSWGRATARRGATERLAPILMTALVTALGLLPVALGTGQPGREIEGPMAIVILGGLITSTILNLAVLPLLAVRYGQFERAAHDEL